MHNTVFQYDVPPNEPVSSFLPGSAETLSLQAKLKEMSGTCMEIPCIIDGEEIFTGNTFEQTAPHDHSQKVCKWHAATPELVDKALESSRRAWKDWSKTPVHVRISIFEKAAQLLAGPWRDVFNASTMLGQSKTCFQAEIDASCELIDFFRFNNYFALDQVYSDQPLSSDGMWNYVDHRPLEGFVYAITPFNFTSIAANLPASAVLMGNVSIWKPSEHSMLSNYYCMKLFEAAGLPKGVINFVPGEPASITQQLLQASDFAGLHYTGSTAVFRKIWQQVGERLGSYRSYPRIVGETGGKDFIFAHSSADPEVVAVAALRGAFEYQGQKCSAASRMYIPKSIWPTVKERMIADMKSIKMGDVSDFSNFMGAVIHERSFDNAAGMIDFAKKNPGAEVVQGGEACKKNGWFIQPTLIECSDPKFKTMEQEIFAPVMSAYVYDDSNEAATLDLVDSTSEYALTGAVIAQDRTAAERITERLRYCAGNFYINDKPSGAVVGQQPFGGARASGTDDKAGSVLNLLRWVAPRTIKETFVPAREYRYPHMG